MEPLLKALQAVLPSAVRAGDLLRVADPDGGMRVVVPQAPWDPQIDHGFVLPFCPAFNDTLGLDACHLRGRLRRSPDAIEAARAYAAGEDVEANANVLAVEAAQQLAEVWKPLTNPLAWTGLGTTYVLQSVNVPPSDAEFVVSLLRAGAYGELGRKEEARRFLVNASLSTEPRVRRTAQLLKTKLADA